MSANSCQNTDMRLVLMYPVSLRLTPHTRLGDFGLLRLLPPGANPECGSCHSQLRPTQASPPIPNETWALGWLGVACGLNASAGAPASIVFRTAHVCFRRLWC